MVIDIRKNVNENVGIKHTTFRHVYITLWYVHIPRYVHIPYKRH